MTSATSLILLGCSERKRNSSRHLPALDRYDGPTFRVLRSHVNSSPKESISLCVLSAKWGLVDGFTLIPRYDRSLSRMRESDRLALQLKVESQWRTILRSLPPLARAFVSVGREYWPMVETTVLPTLTGIQVDVASGGIGGRASRLAH